MQTNGTRIRSSESLIRGEVVGATMNLGLYTKGAHVARALSPRKTNLSTHPRLIESAIVAKRYITRSLL